MPVIDKMLYYIDDNKNNVEKGNCNVYLVSELLGMCIQGWI